MYYSVIAELNTVEQLVSLVKGHTRPSIIRQKKHSKLGMALLHNMCSMVPKRES